VILGGRFSSMRIGLEPRWQTNLERPTNLPPWGSRPRFRSKKKSHNSPSPQGRVVVETEKAAYTSIDPRLRRSDGRNNGRGAAALRARGQGAWDETSGCRCRGAPVVSAKAYSGP